MGSGTWAWAWAWAVTVGEAAGAGVERGRGDGEDPIMPCLIALLVWFASAIGIGWFLARAAALADRRAPHPPAPGTLPDAHSDTL